MTKSLVTIATAALIVGANAFTGPARVPRAVSHLQSTAEAAPEPAAAEPEPVAAEPESEPYNVFEKFDGAYDFRGKKFEFDPLKLASTYPTLVPWFRECELRHGRTAMIAVLGFIATDYMRLPGDMYSFEAIPKTIDAHDVLLKTGPMYQLALWIGLFDLLVTAPAAACMTDGTGDDGERAAGDYSWLTFAPDSKEGFAKKRMAELLNGRLAMIAVGGIATQSIISGHGFPYI